MSAPARVDRYLASFQAVLAAAEATDRSGGRIDLDKAIERSKLALASLASTESLVQTSGDKKREGATNRKYAQGKISCFIFLLGPIKSDQPA